MTATDLTLIYFHIDAWTDSIAKEFNARVDHAGWVWDWHELEDLVWRDRFEASLCLEFLGECGDLPLVGMYDSIAPEEEDLLPF
jgi:hypothetical protein